MKGSVAVLLIALLALSGTWGCATTSTDVSRMTTRSGETAGTVRVAIYDKSSQVEGGVPSARVVRSKLSRLEGKDFVKVYEAEVSSWTLNDVPPGKYLFSVTSWIDEKGKVRTDPAEEGFRLAPGESVKVSAVLEDKRRNTIVTVAAVGGGALVAGIVYAIVNSLSHMTFDLSGTKTR